MFRRLGLVPVLVAALAIVLTAAPVAAGNAFAWSVTRKQCSLTGGAHGEGFVKARAYMEENGRSGTNYFRLYFRMQQQQGSSWVVIDTKAFQTQQFSDSAATNYSVKTSSLAVRDNDLYHRISVKMEWWNARPGADQLLFRKVVNGPRC